MFSKGPKNKDEFQVGDWILVMHGRWTRALKINTSDGEIEIRKVELTSILATSTEKPDGLKSVQNMQTANTQQSILHHLLIKVTHD